MLFYLREDSAGKLALSCKRKRAQARWSLEAAWVIAISLAAGVEALSYRTCVFENP